MPGEAGNLIIGRYALTEPIGEGGMGRVWRGRDKLLNRDVAVKEIPLPPQSPQENAELSARVLREARAAARLDHPGVVAVHEVIEHDGALWVIMRLVPGSSLGAEIGLLGRLPWQRVAPIAGQAAEVLARAHGAGLVHGDLKPGNILLTWPPADTVVLTDFGTARIREAGTRLAGPGAPTGTISCLAPEQLEDGDAGPAADMWALGATLYTAVEGREPFTGSTPAEVRAAVLSAPLTMPEFAGPLRDLIGALLAKNPADRPDAQAAMTALIGPGATNAYGPPPAAASPVGNAAWTPSPYAASLPADWRAPAPRRNVPLVTAVAATAVAVVVALVVVAAIVIPGQIKHDRPPAPPRATSSAGGQAAAPSQPAPGPALTVTQAAALSDNDGFLGIAFSPDGKTLAASAENNGQSAGHVDTWDSRTGHGPAVLAGPAAGGNLLDGMAFSPQDGNTLAVSDLNGVDIWNLATRASHTFVDLDGEAVNDVAYAPDGKTLAEANFAGDIYLLDTVTGEWAEKYFNDPTVSRSQYLVQVAFSPAGKFLAATDMGGHVYVWRLSGGAPLVITGDDSYQYPTQTFAFSPDGGTLAVALKGGVQLWSMATWKLTARLTGPDLTPDAIAFSPQGAVLAVGDEDGNLNLWNLATRQETVADTYAGGWTEVAFSPDGKTLAALETGSDIQLFRIGYPAA